MIKLLSKQFKIFLLVNIPIWIICSYNGWYFVPIVDLLGWIWGALIDGVKEPPIEFNLEKIWFKLRQQNGYVKFEYEGTTYLSKKFYHQLCNDIDDLNYKYEFEMARAFRHWQYEEARAPIFKHSNLWWIRVHIVNLLGVICVVHFFNLPWYFIPLLELSFLQNEIGYYLFTSKYSIIKRFFPKNYNLWGNKETKVITENRLYYILSGINVLYLVLSFNIGV